MRASGTRTNRSLRSSDDRQPYRRRRGIPLVPEVLRSESGFWADILARMCLLSRTPRGRTRMPGELAVRSAKDCRLSDDWTNGNLPPGGGSSKCKPRMIPHLCVIGCVGNFRLRWRWTAAACKDEHHGETAINDGAPDSAGGQCFRTAEDG
jgi:hypothetical protein